MTEQHSVSNSGLKRTNRLKAIAVAGFAAGALDAAAAVVHFMISGGKNPVRIFLFIASGVFGKEAMSGGYFIAFLGLLFHFGIAFSWATIFFLAYPRIRTISRNKFVHGLTFGIFVWLVMNLIVLPLSSVPPIPFDFTKAVIGILILVACVGLPISLIADKHFSKE